MAERTDVPASTDAPDGVPTGGSDPSAPTTPAADPAAAESADPPAPPRKRNSGRLRKWGARLVVLLMIAAAVFIGLQIARSQDARDAALDLGTVTLTSQPIPVETALPGPITTVDVVA